MKVFRAPDAALEPVDPRNFVGNAHVRRLLITEGDEPVVVYFVDFEPGGRTNWHAHSGIQLLLVTEGRGRVQKWGDPPQDLGAGDAVCIEPGEKHWHGALASARMAHFAVNLNLTTRWLEPVSDAQYSAR